MDAVGQIANHVAVDAVLDRAGKQPFTDLLPEQQAGSGSQQYQYQYPYAQFLHQSNPRSVQHSTRLTARPPCDVSL